MGRPEGRHASPRTQAAAVRPDSDSGLFRRQALAAVNDRVYGEGSNPLPLSYRLITGCALMLAAALVGFFSFGEYTARETVRGYVTTPSANVRLLAPRSGVVRALLASDGDVVAEGAPIVRLERRLHTGSGDAAAASIVSLERRLEFIADENRDHERLLALRRAALKRALENGREQLAALDAERQLATRRHDLSVSRHARLAGIAATGHVAPADLDVLRGQVLDAGLALAALRREAIVARNAVERQDSELRELPLAAARAATDRAQRREALREQLELARARSADLLRAPVAGRVSGLALRPGAAVAANEAVAVLLPAADAFSVELLVPGRAAGFVATGDRVRLRVDAFPHRRYGSLDGDVVAVADTPEVPDGQWQHAGLREPGYRVSVRLRAPERLPLRVGMTVAADLMRERRRLADWLLAPQRAVEAQLAP